MLLFQTSAGIDEEMYMKLCDWVMLCVNCVPDCLTALKNLGGIEVSWNVTCPLGQVIEMHLFPLPEQTLISFCCAKQILVAFEMMRSLSSLSAPIGCSFDVLGVQDIALASLEGTLADGKTAATAEFGRLACKKSIHVK